MAVSQTTSQASDLVGVCSTTYARTLRTYQYDNSIYRYHNSQIMSAAMGLGIPNLMASRDHKFMYNLVISTYTIVYFKFKIPNNMPIYSIEGVSRLYQSRDIL